MKIFEGGADSWDKKINFVDDNNVLVGFDMNSDCCECFGWYVSTVIQDDIGDDSETPDVEDYTFSTTDFISKTKGDYDIERLAIFTLVADGQPNLYLHLYNAHNGYYSHGFDIEVGGEKVGGGSL
jgi:hypothetical protein